MKKIILIIIVFFNTNIFAMDLKPLSEVLEKLDANDDVTKMYVFTRCSGMYGALWDSMLSNNKKEMAEVMLKNQQDLAIYAVMIDMKLNNRTADESAIKQKNNIQKIKDEYVAIFNKNWFENGAYFQGSWVEGDVQLCGPIVSAIQASQ